MSSEKRNLWLDLIRGISALLVCLGHLRNALLVDFSSVEHPTLLIKVFYLLTSFGHQAVMVFFVLSGYLVGGGVLRAGLKFSWGNYLVSRFTRLWVVLIPCLLLTWGVGELLLQLAPDVLKGAFFDSWHSGPKPSEYEADLTTFIANLFFLQTIVTPVFGLNGPLWSLANEFWYYLLFPLLVASSGLITQKGKLTRIFSMLLAVGIIYFIPSQMQFGFLIWMLGVAVYCLQAKINHLNVNAKRVALLFGLICFLIGLVYSKSSSLMQMLQVDADLLVGLTFAIFCLSLSHQAFPQSRQSWLARASVYLSDISYSLYLFHFPIVLLVASTVYASQKLAPTAMVMAQFFVWSICLLLLGALMFYLFESRTAFVRNKVSKLLLNKKEGIN